MLGQYFSYLSAREEAGSGAGVATLHPPVSTVVTISLASRFRHATSLLVFALQEKKQNWGSTCEQSYSLLLSNSDR